MPTVFPIDTYRADVARIAESVFVTMLGLEVAPAEAAWSPAPDRMTAAIYFAGSWSGAVLVECSPEQTAYFLRRMVPSSQAAPFDDDARDALGELANMLAGNLKSVLPKGVYLTVPSVTVGTDYTLRICGGNITERLGFDSPCGVFWITLVEIAE